MFRCPTKHADGGRVVDVVSVTSVNTPKQTINVTTKVDVKSAYEPSGPSGLHLAPVSVI